jgi:hypothetical protein
VRTRKVYKEYRGSLNGSLIEQPHPRPLYQRLTPLGWISVAGLSLLLLIGIASVTNLLIARTPNAIAATQQVPQPTAQVMALAEPKQVMTELRATEQPAAQPVASAQLAQSKQPTSGRQQNWIATLLTRPVAVAVVPSAIMIFCAVIASLVWKRRDYA